MFNKDGLKELLSDSLRVVSLRGSRRFEDPSFALLLYISRTLLSHGFSVIIEGNFKKGSDMEEFGKQLKGSGITVVEIFCKAPGELLIERFMNRMNERHAIHPRIMPVRFLRELQLNGMTPLSIGKILEVDVPLCSSFVGRGRGFSCRWPVPGSQRCSPCRCRLRAGWRRSVHVPSRFYACREVPSWWYSPVGNLSPLPSRQTRQRTHTQRVVYFSISMQISYPHVGFINILRGLWCEVGTAILDKKVYK